ncbi:MAG: long-chain fatty acid--CoA ligase [Sphingomonas bacterium]|uniref:long-chain fatty acid--CoA ligase n=1 Tax=Sphingomonas bacterium TaxID=1895847 RepID=UPI002607B931|nr:long-chain fatty acid--CoA ligase [Sphingomonas bacterium]MDB5695583.1 long-chain fatty acid--CoA ligase [Sphingomonas bacterium]
MLGGMQDFELRVPRLLEHAEREHGRREIVSRWADGTETRSDWAEVAANARKLAQALKRMGCQVGDRIATLGMNHAHHLTAWYGAIGMGGVIHTINPRLFDEQLVYIANHAEDRVLFYDKAFQPIVDRLRPQWTTIEHFVCFDDGSFNSLIDPESGDYAWHEGPEREPCMLCYTSGTTGDPKGVLYEHRSTMIHAMAEVAPAVFNLSARSVVLPIVPMFHAAAWGLPFAGALAGAKFVYSATNDAAVLCDLMNREKVTHSAGVPTVWLAMFGHTDATGEAPRFLQQVTIGGSAAPRAMIERIMGMGVEVKHLWGMTETSPIGTAGSPPADWDEYSHEQKLDRISKQGQVPFGVELRVIDDAEVEQPRDGVSSGRLQVRGPWVVKRYFQAEADAIDSDGWFDTGDVSVMHPDGTMQITDRAKDVIKSGGEWISSVELENAAVGCPGVAEAAAIGIAHPKWDERPLLLVVRKPGSAVTAGEVRAHLATAVAKWWLPDAVEFLDDLPHTATGKLLKSALRERFKDYRLEEA